MTNRIVLSQYRKVWGRKSITFNLFSTSSLVNNLSRSMVSLDMETERCIIIRLHRYRDLKRPPSSAMRSVLLHDCFILAGDRPSVHTALQSVVETIDFERQVSPLRSKFTLQINESSEPRPPLELSIDRAFLSLPNLQVICRTCRCFLTSAFSVQIQFHLSRRLF